MEHNIYEYFDKSAKKYPENIALNVNGESFTYTQLEALASSLAICIASLSEERFIGVFAHRSIAAFSAVLGILKSGNAYVPLNPKFPADRNKLIQSLSGIEIIIVGSECLDQIEGFVNHLDTPMNLVFPDSTSKELSGLSLGSHQVISKDDLSSMKNSSQELKTSAYAYMLFTSGSTGIPKGVPIYQYNVISYVSYLTERYGQIDPSDRFSNTFDLTFDLSVHDMFLCWCKGASLYCIPEKTLFAPAKFIKENQISVWFSVPSLVKGMSRLRMLKEKSFPSLKLSLFCGEPLPVRIADLWQKAAENSVVENIYGPTEATIGITHYRWNKTDIEKNKEYNQILSIGKIFSSQDFRILDDNKKEVPIGADGELYLGGSQVTRKYWNNPEKTKDHFFDLMNENKPWFRTGDLVRIDEDGDIYFVGRKDFQIKIRGYRVELLEIDNLIMQEYGLNDVISIPYPIVDGSAEKIYTFILKGQASEDEVLQLCKSKMPEYMVPDKVIVIDDFPLNPNGKIDRKKLVEILTDIV